MNPDWRKVKISEGESALTWIQITQEEDDVSCSCYFTDLINIYSEHLNKTAIETRFQDRNPGMETDDYQDFLTNVRTALSDSENSAISVVKENDSCNVDVDWTIEGIEYKWFFRTSLGPVQLFYKLVSYPLISGFEKLRQDKETLLSIVEAKDLEIEDYENNGSKLSRKKLRTGRFDPEKDLEVFDDEKTSGPATTVDIVDSPKMREILRTTSVKAFCGVKTETKGIKDGDTTSSKERMISESSPAQILNNPPAQNSDKTLAESEEDKSIKKIMTEKPNLKRIAQSSSNRFKLNKKKKF